MSNCTLCHNDYDRSFDVIMNNKTYTFDCFECAIQLLAPICSLCYCKVIGHGVEKNKKIYCCAHCARSDGVSELKDRA